MWQAVDMNDSGSVKGGLLREQTRDALFFFFPLDQPKPIAAQSDQLIPRNRVPNV